MLKKILLLLDFLLVFARSLENLAEIRTFYEETEQISRILREMSADLSEEIARKSEKCVNFA